MGASALGSRAIIGEFYARLEQEISTSWISRISNYFPSNQESETYPWLGQVPAMREWVGGRNAKGLSTQSITIRNIDFEATLEILVKDLRRDKTAQIMARIGELAERTNSHWAKLLTTLIVGGSAGTCYDGKKFFAANHTEGKSGTQSNLLTVNVVDEDAPTAGEFEDAILQAVQALYTLKDNEGEPINENARQFLVMVGPQHFSKSAAALKNPIVVDGSTSRTNTLVNLAGYTFELQPQARLADADTSFFVFRTDASIRPFIVQEEQGVKVDAIAEGSELEFKENKHHYGVSAIRNAGYGMWQRAVQVTFNTGS
jgi:phage major head subunit gpT-like protein